MGGEIGDARDHLAGLGRSEIGVGREAHQIGVAAIILGEKRDATVGAAAGARLRRDRRPSRGEGERQREPDDGLDANLGEGFGEFERAEEIVEVGERERGAPSALASAASFGMVSAPSSSE